MNGVTGQHAFAILQLARLRRKFSRVTSIHLTESKAHLVTRGLILAIEEKPAAHHLKAFTGTHGLPNRFHSTKCMLDLFKCALASLAAYLIVRLGNGGNYQAAFRGARSLGELLNESYKVIESARGQLLGTIKFLRIGNKLIHQDQAAPARVEEIRQSLRPGRNTSFVGVLDVVVKFGPARRLR